MSEHACSATARVARFYRKRELEAGIDSSRQTLRAVASARGGDEEGVRYLYATYADNVYGYVCSILRDEYEAEDVTQHVFGRLVVALQRYEQRSMPFSAWILRVAHNAAIDHMRVRRPIPSVDLRAEQSTSDEGLLDCCLLQDALAEVPEDQRRVLVMRHVLGLTPPEIASRLGKSENAVHGLHHRGRRTLQEKLRTRGMIPVTVDSVSHLYEHR